MLLPYLPISYVFFFLMVVIQSVSARVSWFTLSLSFHYGHFVLTRFWLVYIPFVLTDCDRNVVQATVLGV